MNKCLKFVLGVLTVVSFLFITNLSAQAQENQYDVDTQKISFTLIQREGSEEENDANQANGSLGSKPIGKLPSTGEILQSKLFMIGLLLLFLIGLIMLVIKKNKWMRT